MVRPQSVVRVSGHQRQDNVDHRPRTDQEQGTKTQGLATIPKRKRRYARAFAYSASKRAQAFSACGSL